MKKIIMVLIVVSSLCVGCGYQESQTKRSVPYGATDVVYMDDGWAEFTYKNQRFLYRNEGAGYRGVSALAVIE